MFVPYIANSKAVWRLDPAGVSVYLIYLWHVNTIKQVSNLVAGFAYSIRGERKMCVSQIWLELRCTTNIKVAAIHGKFIILCSHKRSAFGNRSLKIH